MTTSRIEAPFYPIIYVRGYAGTDSDVEDTVSDPYMGFNLGSTRIRTLWTGETERFFFESPLVRLMKDHNYRDVYSAGLSQAELDDVQPGSLDPRSIIIYRYYDLVSSVFGAGKQITMEDFGKGLNVLIEKVRDRICITPADRTAFRVYLVGHSMGGLVIRCLLQNPKIGTPEIKKLVDKVFTYATPHNGIDLDIIGNVPAFFTHNSADNFNRQRMCEYLSLPPNTDPVNTLNNRFDPDRFFCLIGTNPKDYTVASGWSSRVVGPFSDGLVRINNALVCGPQDRAGSPPMKLAPRAYVHRSHSGYYGIVNSEEGYQNLVRFLFGDARVDGVLEIHNISLPDEVKKAHEAGKEVRASYHFEAITRVRGVSWDLSRRVASENSTVFRKFGELFPKHATKIDRPDVERPQLFTAFLSAKARVNTHRPSLGFSLDLGVLVPDYEVGGKLWLNNHYAGGYIFREKINLEATPPTDRQPEWRLRYGFDRSTPNRATRNLAPQPLPEDVPGTASGSTIEFRVPVVQKNRPGIQATLIITARAWN